MIFRILVLFLFIFSTATCQQKQVVKDSMITIAFGSCNKQNLPQVHWKPILNVKPDLFIWGGDNVYGDTEDMSKLKAKYQLVKNDEGYQKLNSTVPIIGTWDDHDYGKNDSGAEWVKKEESQELFLDFFDVPENDSRRKQEGIYSSYTLENKVGTVKVILLDTRYFRSPLKKDVSGNKRYVPNNDGAATLLGKAQWDWLAEELSSSDADFHIIVSSIQFLSREHGFETWGNFPQDINKMEQLLKTYNNKKVLFLSGDRHISEFSKQNLEGLPYPIIDFTSSGLTHSYRKNDKETNPYRIQDLIVKKSFGLVTIDLNRNKVIMQMYALNGKKLQELVQEYD